MEGAMGYEYTGQTECGSWLNRLPGPGGDQGHHGMAWDETERGQPESILDRPIPTEVVDEGVWNVAWQEHISALRSKDSELKLKCKAALLKARAEWVLTHRRERMLELDINRFEQKQWLEQKRFEEKYEIKLHNKVRQWLQDHNKDGGEGVPEGQDKAQIHKRGVLKIG